MSAEQQCENTEWQNVYEWMLKSNRRAIILSNICFWNTTTQSFNTAVSPTTSGNVGEQCLYMSYELYKGVKYELHVDDHLFISAVISYFGNIRSFPLWGCVHPPIKSPGTTMERWRNIYSSNRKRTNRLEMLQTRQHLKLSLIDSRGVHTFCCSFASLFTRLFCVTGNVCFQESASRRRVSCVRKLHSTLWLSCEPKQGPLHLSGLTEFPQGVFTVVSDKESYLLCRVAMHQLCPNLVLIVNFWR